MPFGDITVNTKTYSPRQPGIYSESSVTYDAPQNEFRVTGGRSNKNGISAAVTRVLQKDVTEGPQLNRKSAVVTLQLSMPVGTGFTANELDSLASDISEFLSPATVSRLLQGEA